MKATLVSMDSPMSQFMGNTIGAEVLGYMIDKFGDDVYSLTAVNIVADIKENYENSVAIGGAINIMGTSQLVDALAIQTGVITVSGDGINEAVLVCPKYDSEELRIRVEAYNSVNINDTIKVDECGRRCSYAGHNW